MGNFDKKAYNDEYMKNKTDPYNWRISVTQRAALDEYCTNNNIKISAYLKKLIDEDMKKQGLPKIFAK